MSSAESGFASALLMSGPALGGIILSVVLSWNDFNYRLNAVEVPATLRSTRILRANPYRRHPRPDMLLVKYSFIDATGLQVVKREEYRADIGIPSPLIVQYLSDVPDSGRLKRPRSRVPYYVVGVCGAVLLVGVVWTCLEVRRLSRWTSPRAT